MKGIEPILYQHKEVACIYRKNLPVKGIRFLTTPDNFFQIGIHDRKDKIKLPPHTHNCPKPLTVNAIQELLYVIRGKIRVTLVSEDQKLIAEKLLSAGDAVLFISEGHGVEFLGNARVFEIKQGPYPGAENAKHYLA